MADKIANVQAKPLPTPEQQLVDQFVKLAADDAKKDMDNVLFERANSKTGIDETVANRFNAPRTQSQIDKYKQQQVKAGLEYSETFSATCSKLLDANPDFQKNVNALAAGGSVEDVKSYLSYRFIETLKASPSIGHDVSGVRTTRQALLYDTIMKGALGDTNLVALARDSLKAVEQVPHRQVLAGLSWMNVPDVYYDPETKKAYKKGKEITPTSEEQASVDKLIPSQTALYEGFNKFFDDTVKASPELTGDVQRYLKTPGASLEKKREELREKFLDNIVSMGPSKNAIMAVSVSGERVLSPAEEVGKKVEDASKDFLNNAVPGAALGDKTSRVGEKLADDTGSWLSDPFAAIAGLFSKRSSGAPAVAAPVLSFEEFKAQQQKNGTNMVAPNVPNLKAGAISK